MTHPIVVIINPNIKSMITPTMIAALLMVMGAGGMGGMAMHDHAKLSELLATADEVEVRVDGDEKIIEIRNDELDKRFEFRKDEDGKNLEIRKGDDRVRVEINEDGAVDVEN